MIAFTVAGCDALSDPENSVPWSLIPQTVTIAVGQKQQIGAATGAITPKWTSDNPGAVSVSTTGLASALSPGRAHVVVRLGGRADTTLVIVHAAIRAVHMAASSTPLALGGAMGLGYTAIDPAGDEIRDLQGTTIQWVSRNGDVASVDSAGLIRAKSLGATEIVLSINGFTDSTLVRVTPEALPGSPVEPIPPSPQPVKPPTAANPPAAPPATASVTVTLDSASLAPGHASAAHAVAKDPKGNVLSGKTAIWSSLNTSVATVSTAGVVTAQKAGTASIQGAIDGVSGTASITVTVPPVVQPPVAPPPTNSPDLAEPTFDGASKMVFQQDFDTYTTDSIRPACGTSPPPKRVVDNAVQHCTPGGGWTYDGNVTLAPGHTGNSVAIRYDGIYQEAHGAVVALGASTGKAMTVVQYWTKFTPDPGYSLTDGNAIVQIKNIMLWSDQTRFQWDTHAHNSGCSYHAKTATTIGGLEMVDNGCDSDQPVGPYFQNFADGQWHRWTVEYKPNTSTNVNARPITSTRDGVARLWIDGILTNNLERGACGITPPGGYKPWCDPVELDGLWGGNIGVTALQWGANRTDGSGIKFTMSVDDVKVWTMK